LLEHLVAAASLTEGLKALATPPRSIPRPDLALAINGQEVSAEEPVWVRDPQVQVGVRVRQPSVPDGEVAEVRWHLDDGHSATVGGHAETLFDETRSIHDLGPVERELLGAAARLHDVGTRISVDKHHKHGAYIVEHAGLRGFSPDEVAMLACLVRFQRGSAPRPSYPPYEALLPSEREACRTLVGLLRVAHALARGGADDVTSIRVEASGDELVIHIEGGNPVHAVTDANEHAALLSRTLGSSVRFAYAEAGAAS